MRAEFIGSWLLTYLLHSTLLLGTAWIVTLRGVRSPALRDLIWKTALVGGLVTATVQVGAGWQPLAGAVSLVGREMVTPSTSTGEEWRGIMREPLSVATARAPRATGGSDVPAGIAPVAPVTVEPAALEPAPVEKVVPSRPSVSLLLALLAGWGILAGGMLTRYLVQRATVLRRIGPRRPVREPVLVAMLDTLRHLGKVHQPVQLTAASGLNSPVALGQAEIALPDAALTELDREQQRSMLAHELAHLVRRDPAWLAAACVIERLFFLQPLNRLARVRMQEAAELLCDDWAVHRTGSGFSLASCLVKVAEWVDTPPHPVPLAGMAEHRSQLVTRIHRLIEGRPMSTAPRSLWFAAGAVALLGVTAVAAPGVTSHNSSPGIADSAASEDAYLADVSAMDLAALAGVSDTDSVVGRSARTTEEERAMVELNAQMRSMRTSRADMRRALSRARVEMRAPRPPRAPHTPHPPSPAEAPVAWGHAGSADVAWARAWGGNSSRRQDTTSIAVPALIAALRDPDVEVRRVAVQSLSNFEDPRAVPGLVGALKDTDTEVRMYAAVALGNLGDERALPGLLAALKDSNSEVRQHALSALQSMPKVPDEAILTALSDSDTDVRQQAISLAVSRMSDHDDDDNVKADPRYITAFGRLLTDADADIRHEAAHGLGSAGLSEPPAVLLAASKDKSADVRQAVAEALGQIGHARGVPTLKEMLADANADVREQAIESLSEIRDQSALEALVGALKSSDPVVRRSAAEALGSRDEE
jgi:HEAT repeat protein/beta-lactamase regulating signal transducer with metallopeptidase domain